MEAESAEGAEGRCLDSAWRWRGRPSGGWRCWRGASRDGRASARIWASLAGGRTRAGLGNAGGDRGASHVNMHQLRLWFPLWIF